MHRLFAFAMFLFVNQIAVAEDWAEFLGPKGSAKSNDSVPTTWSNDENLLWKVDLPGGGSSSPIIVGDRVFLTCYVSSPSPERQVLCFDRQSGKSQWRKSFPVNYREDPLQGYITEHGYASNTPVSDGKFVYVFFGKGGVHCLDLAGQVIWSVEVGKESSNRQWGSAASLILYENSVIVNAAEESKAIISLDKATGKELWRQEAGMLELTYGTPRLVQLSNGQTELVISVPSELWAMNPKTGKLSWYASSSMTGNVSPSVIVDGETIYSFGGYRSSGSMAVRAGGKDDVSETNTLWTSKLSSYVATPLLYDERFYWIDDRGIAFCSSAKTGEQIYRERVSELEGGRPVYASPVFVGGNIYVVSRRRGTFVYSPSDQFKVISQNIFAGDDTDFNATPAVADGKLYLRSDKALYCVGN
jgi:outer membrane protein assembly factor BamB